MIIGIDMGHSLNGVGTGATGLMIEVEKNREVGNLLIKYLKEKGKENKMIIGIDMGHSLNGVGTGATGLMIEVEKNREVGNLLIKYLKEKGHTVINCTVDKAFNSNEQLNGIIRKANAQHLDYFISLHLNAHNSNANGTETWIQKGNYKDKQATKRFAEKVNTEVVNSCGFTNRGVKEGNYHVCRETNAKAILVELCFCTSEIDKSKWNTEKIAKGLFKGITGEDYLRDEWMVDDWCKIHGHTTHYATGDVIAPHGYEYKIVDIQGDNVLEQV